MSHVKGSIAKAQSVSVGSAGSKLSILAGVVAVIGLVCCVMALGSDEGKQRFGFAYLWGFTLVWSVVLGSLFFVILHHLSGAVWSVVFRRIAEMFAAQMWLVALFFIPIIVICFWHGVPLFSWIEHPVVVKEAYLNGPFFVIRGIVFFVLWILFARFLIGKSLQQDDEPATVGVTLQCRKFSAPFMILFAFTLTFASFDWLMSLEPHWFSTIFGVYIFAGVVLVGLAVITLSVIWLRHLGRLGEGIITSDHLYSLGCLMFVFTCFWAYIWFSQFMLIWYANIPEETIWFSARGWGPDGNPNWTGLTWAILIVRFVVPFVLLLSSRAKVNPRILVWSVA